MIKLVAMNEGQREDVEGNDNDVDDDVNMNNDRDGDDPKGRRGQRVWQRPGGHDDNDKIEYGYRRSRRRMSYKNRCSSSHTPAQIMEQETYYYRYAKLAVERVVFILHLVLLNQATYVALCSLVGQWSGVSVANVASVVKAARAKMKRSMGAVHHLLFVVRWIRAHGKIALLHAEDL
jgi:hypothetical protein